MDETTFWCVLLMVFPFIGAVIFWLAEWIVDWLAWFIREQKEFLEYEKAKNEWLDYEPTPEEFLENKYGN